MCIYSLSDGCQLLLQQGDLTDADTDAIVNAANELMLGGGGVDGAIHRRAGPQLLEACREVPEVLPGVRCPTGESRLTPGFKLRARYVIHTVGPVFTSHEASAPLLAAAYEASLDVANEHALASVAFPALSCGAFGYPLQAAAEVALRTCQRYHGALRHVRFVLFGPESFASWQTAAEDLFARP